MATPSFNFKAEYAKSARSSCNQCGNTIEKDELRLAEMVQAPNFDGKIPRWYHVKCFFTCREFTVPDVNEVGNFDSLRWEDQQMIKEKCATAGVTYELRTEYARSGRSTCRGCLQKIKDCALRVGVQEPENEDSYEYSSLLWYHPDCLKKVIVSVFKMKNVKAEDFVGYKNLKSADKKKVREMLGETEEADKTSSDSGKGKKRKGHSTGGPVDKKQKQENTEEMALKAQAEMIWKIKDALNSDLNNALLKEMLLANKQTAPSSNAKVDKMSKKMKEVQQNNICVVSEEYLDDVQKGGGLVKIMAHKISSWGDIKLAKSGQQQSTTAKLPVAASFNPDPFCKMKKLAVKGGAVVDPDSGLSKTHHVYETGGVIYNAVLGLVDIVQGTNSFYKLQLLEDDSSKKYILYRAWGRVGTSFGGNKREDHGGSVKKAIAQFESLYAEKTGNQWGTPSDQFVKYPKKFYPLEIDYGQDEVDFAQMMVSAGTTSKLDPAIQSLVRMIFDVDSMKQTLLEFEIDVNKMPLGKLSKKQIESAYKVLTEALTEIQGDKNPTKLLDASNRFYTLIPHDFGLQSPPLLDNEEIIKSKTQMLDNLLEIEITYSLLKEQIKSDVTDQRDPLDINYEKLKTDCDVLGKDTEEFKMLEEYVTNTHAPTHSSYSLELMDVFKIERHGEDKRYQSFKRVPNRKLLWHGSRTTNYAGILSQGLRIAPPEAPVTGYMFGKGVYFADMVSKSANYCFTPRDNPVGLLLLCEVALGEMYELKHSKFVVKPPDGKLSTKGLGQTHPDPSKDITLPDGVVVPQGKGVNSNITNSSLMYNEYIVYDVAQINMKYLLKTKFNYKKSAWGW